MNTNVLFAIFKRNFVAYFANPTGYVFICVFVLLSSFAAFWPAEFFNDNLANLDQLNRYFPMIMLIFIPAITMSVWAEERRGGTDELLLTIPATDIEVVLGKYLSVVTIYSVSLLFSLVSNFIVLSVLGSPDMGLLLSTYFGYWMIGIAMLAIGMVASFLTANLTVGFILGVIFNAPLVFSANAELIMKDPSLVRIVDSWSLSSQFQDFARGIISLSSIIYFVMIASVAVYVSVVLIGRRHWLGGRDGHSMFGHYVARTVSLVVLGVGLCWFARYHDYVRADVTVEQLSSLSPSTVKLIKDLETDYAVEIEAYVSPEVPPEYVQHRVNLMSVLEELSSIGGKDVKVVIHPVEPLSEEASIAEEKHGIEARPVRSKTRGTFKEEEIYLGVAFRCGLEKEVIPFLDRGLSPEYELIRSICTVAQEKRKKVGIVKTDAPLFGTFNMQARSMMPDHMLIAELEKQYEVEEVDLSKPLEKEYDVLLAVQPSTLPPEQMKIFIETIKSGQPTAIFEDPAPVLQGWAGMSATSAPRVPPQMNQMMMMMMGQRPQSPPKGDINELWKLLGVEMVGDGASIVWQDYNPYPKLENFISSEWVFVDRGSGAQQAFAKEAEISSKLQQLLFVYPGSWREDKKNPNSKTLNFVKLATTNNASGTIEFEALQRAFGQGRGAIQEINFAREKLSEKFAPAVHIFGKLPPEDKWLKELQKANKTSGLSSEQDDMLCADDSASAEEKKQKPDSTDEEKPAESKSSDEQKPKDQEQEINVVLVADADCLVSALFAMRAQGSNEDDPFDLNVDNVSFVLNTLDVLAGDNRFVDIRSRRRTHRTLEKIENKTKEARNSAAEESKKFSQKFEDAKREAQAAFDKRIETIRNSKDMSQQEILQQVALAMRDGQRKLENDNAKLAQERDREVQRIERKLTAEVRAVQDQYKLSAVIIPAIPPLLLACFVFFHRRSQEKLGVSKDRLR